MVIFEGDIESTFDAVDEIVEVVLKKIKSTFEFMSDRYLFNINFMMREIMNNAVEHGNHFSPDKKIHCRVDYLSPVLAFIIKDEGEGFKAEDIPTESHDPRSLLRERNRGHQTILDMDFNIKIDKNQVKILLNLNQEVILWKNNY